MFRSRKLSYSYPSTTGQFNADYADLPLKKLLVDIPVTQTGSGTPSPDNIRDFIGVSGVNITRTGKNLFSGQNITERSYITSSGDIKNTGGWNVSDYIPVSANTVYTFTPNTTSGLAAYNAFYDSNKNFLGGSHTDEFTFTTPNNCKFVRLSFRSSSYDIQFEHGNTATPYEPYTGNTYQITFGQTVYSANLDVVTGKLSITHGLATFDGSENWVKATSRLGTYYIGGWVNDNSITNTTDHLQNIGTTVDTYPEMARQTYACLFRYDLFFKVDNDLYPTLADFKNFLSQNNLQIWYPLATPIEIPLGGIDIKTLQGVNNIFTDIGTVETQCIKLGN